MANVSDMETFMSSEKVSAMETSEPCYMGKVAKLATNQCVIRR